MTRLREALAAGSSIPKSKSASLGGWAAGRGALERAPAGRALECGRAAEDFVAGGAALAPASEPDDGPSRMAAAGSMASGSGAAGSTLTTGTASGSAGTSPAREADAALGSSGSAGGRSSGGAAASLGTTRGRAPAADSSVYTCACCGAGGGAAGLGAAPKRHAAPAATTERATAASLNPLETAPVDRFSSTVSPGP